MFSMESQMVNIHNLIRHMISITTIQHSHSHSAQVWTSTIGRNQPPLNHQHEQSCYHSTCCQITTHLLFTSRTLYSFSTSFLFPSLCFVESIIIIRHAYNTENMEISVPYFMIRPIDNSSQHLKAFFNSNHAQLQVIQSSKLPCEVDIIFILHESRPQRGEVICSRLCSWPKTENYMLIVLYRP